MRSKEVVMFGVMSPRGRRPKRGPRGAGRAAAWGHRLLLSLFLYRAAFTRPSRPAKPLQHRHSLPVSPSPSRSQSFLYLPLGPLTPCSIQFLLLNSNLRMLTFVPRAGRRSSPHWVSLTSLGIRRRRKLLPLRHKISSLPPQLCRQMLLGLVHPLSHSIMFLLPLLNSNPSLSPSPLRHLRSKLLLRLGPAPMPWVNNNNLTSRPNLASTVSLG